MKPRPGLHPNNSKPRKVNVITDTLVDFPDLWLEVFLAGENQFEDKLLAEMFVRAHCQKADTPEAADIVVFGGGSDVNPALYGEEPHPKTHWNTRRDERDMKLYKECLKLGIPMFGICRGSQFLAVMNGYKLYQDIDNHNGNHAIYDKRSGKQIHNVSSVHHQSVIKPSKDDLDFELIASCSKSQVRWYNPILREMTGGFRDVEAYFIHSTCCLGVQGHPEYRGYYNYLQYVLGLLKDYIVDNPDLEFRKSKRRLKVDMMNQRDDLILAKQKAMN